MSSSVLIYVGKNHDEWQKHSVTVQQKICLEKTWKDEALEFDTKGQEKGK